MYTPFAGDNFDEYVISPISVRVAQRTYPSSAFLLPNNKYWGADEVILTTPDKNYTVGNYETLFGDLGCELCWELFKDTRNLVHDIKAPGEF